MKSEKLGYYEINIITDASIQKKGLYGCWKSDIIIFFVSQ